MSDACAWCRQTRLRTQGGGRSGRRRDVRCPRTAWPAPPAHAWGGRGLDVAGSVSAPSSSSWVCARPGRTPAVRPRDRQDVRVEVTLVQLALVIALDVRVEVPLMRLAVVIVPALGVAVPLVQLALEIVRDVRVEAALAQLALHAAVATQVVARLAASGRRRGSCASCGQPEGGGRTPPRTLMESRIRARCRHFSDVNRLGEFAPLHLVGQEVPEHDGEPKGGCTRPAAPQQRGSSRDQ